LARAYLEVEPAHGLDVAVALAQPGDGDGVLAHFGGILRYPSANSVIFFHAGAATVPPKMLPVEGSSTMTAASRRGCAAGAKPTKLETYLEDEYSPVTG